MKRPFFRTFFITVFHHRGSLPDGEFVVPSFGKTFLNVFQITTICSFSFLIRFSMNNPYSLLQVLGGLEWTRTTDLPLIRRVL